VLAALSWSAAGILQRQLRIDAATQLAGRGSFAFIVLAAYVLAFRRGEFKALWDPWTLLVALGTAVASSSFIVALNHTSVAHVLFFQAASPIGAAVLGSRVLDERTSRRTWLAMGVAIAGVLLMVSGPAGGANVGDGLALVAALAFAVVIVCSRRQRGVTMGAAICLAQLLVAVCFLPFAHVAHLSPRDLFWLALLGLQIAFGTMFFTFAAGLVPATEMALLFLLEVILGPLWTWLGVSERPSATTLLGGAIVVAAVVVQVTGGSAADGPTETAPAP
jgi:drug/metabolite transporter (DMT)-like permease